MKETKDQRLARLENERNEELKRWNDEKCFRVLYAIANANDLGLDTNICFGINAIKFSIRDYNEDYDLINEDIYSLQEWQMNIVEESLNNIRFEKEKRERYRIIRQQVLDRLTDEEREALEYKD